MVHVCRTFYPRAPHQMWEILMNRDTEADEDPQTGERDRHVAALLQSADPADRIAAARVLGASGDTEAIPHLLAAFYDPVKEVRAHASAAVAMLGAAAVGPLIGMLQEPNWMARYRAAEALSRIGDISAVEPLLRALDDPIDHVRYMSAKALGIIGDARAFEPLQRVLRDENEFVRRSAAIALWAIGGGKARPALAEALRCEECEEVRQTLAEILDVRGSGR